MHIRLLQSTKSLPEGTSPLILFDLRISREEAPRIFEILCNGLTPGTILYLFDENFNLIYYKEVEEK